MKKAIPKIEDLICRAWRLRYGQKIEEFSAIFSELKTRLSGVEKGFGADQLALLQCSWLRLQGKISESQALLARMGERFGVLGLAPPFEYWMQRGLNALIQGDHTCAVDEFLAARQAAEGPEERLWALSNAFFCFENLGLPSDLTWDEIQKEMAACKSQGLKRDESVYTQIRAWSLRRAFRQGRLPEVFATEEPKTPGQAGYFRLWLAELPFHRFYGVGQGNALERFALYPPHFHQKPYRLRTLQGLIHPDDLGDPKATEFADRLYLWTWRWLMAPEEFPVERVMALVRDIRWEAISSRFTAEDYQMVRNSLLWLSVFDPSSAAVIHEKVASLRPMKAEDEPVYRLERQVIGWLTAKRDEDRVQEADLLRLLQLDPLWKSRDLFLAALADRDRDAGPLVGLRARLQQWIECPLRDSPKGLKVDLTLHQLRLPGEDKTVVSEPLCQAFDLLQRRRVVDCGELAFACFGISRFDSTVHSTKIFNLLARMRLCAPEGLGFNVKAGKVYASGSWDQVAFKRKTGFSGALREQPEWRELLRRRAGAHSREADEKRMHTALVLEKLAGQSEIKREDVERITGKSRSTVNRILNRWLRRGVVQRSGSARNTRYRVMRPFQGQA